MNKFIYGGKSGVDTHFPASIIPFSEAHEELPLKFTDIWNTQTMGLVYKCGYSYIKVGSFREHRLDLWCHIKVLHWCPST